MFSVKFGGTRWRWGVPFLLLLTLLLTLDKSGMAVLCLLASFLHEGGHIAALLLVGYPPREVTVGVCGIRLVPHPHPLDLRRQTAVLLAGPAVNLLSAAVLRWAGCAPAAMAAHTVLGVFNLLPIEALDGGQVLFCAVQARGGSVAAERVVRWLSVAVLLPLSTLGFWLFLQYYNPSLCLVCIYLVARLFSHERI
ncbi:MAG: hypothetical protein E7552_06135 [Ruminococcaceae bacterium]|nr:hypothetical protein [Oscillospiraceae bacterium]